MECTFIMLGGERVVLQFTADQAVKFRDLVGVERRAFGETTDGMPYAINMQHVTAFFARPVQ